MASENFFFDLKRLKYLGKGAIIGKTVRIRKPEEVSIGDGTIIDDFTYISCSAEIGAHCHIAPNVTISGGGGHLKMGSYSGISAGSSLHVASSDYIRVSLDMPSIPEHLRFGGEFGSIEIGNFVLIGAHSVVLPNAVLPEGMATGAHTIVRNKEYEPWTLYIGPDAKKLLRRDPSRIMSMRSQLGV